MVEPLAVPWPRVAGGDIVEKVLDMLSLSDKRHGRSRTACAHQLHTKSSRGITVK